jgi:hypothetical protein
MEKCHACAFWGKGGAGRKKAAKGARVASWWLAGEEKGGGQIGGVAWRRGMGGSGAVVGWLAAIWEWRSWAVGGTGEPHGSMPTDRGGSATDMWAWPQCRAFEPIQIGQLNSNEFEFESNCTNLI